MKPIWVEVECSGVGNQIADAAKGLGLTVKEMPVKSPPGARHWHLSKPATKGTLEITWLPGNQLIIETRANRSAEWQPAAAELLVRTLASEQ